jgi:hypothetical protein
MDDLILLITAFVVIVGLMISIFILSIISLKPEIKNTCPQCKSPLSLMRSTSKKECTSCTYSEDWKLNKDQLPLVRSNRMVKRKE